MGNPVKDIIDRNNHYPYQIQIREFRAKCQAGLILARHNYVDNQKSMSWLVRRTKEDEVVCLAYRDVATAYRILDSLAKRGVDPHTFFRGRKCETQTGWLQHSVSYTQENTSMNVPAQETPKLNFPMRRVVVAKFESGSQEYSYFVPEGDSPEVGDLIITSIRSSMETNTSKKKDEVLYIAEGKPNVATIISTTPLYEKAEKATRYYILLLKQSRVDEIYALNKQTEAVVAEQRRIRDRLRQIYLEQGEQEIWNRLAEKNPEAAELLSKLTSK